MRALRTLARRPGALLGLGAALTAAVPACACGLGFALVPLIGAALLRTALDAATPPDAPTLASPRAPLRVGPVALFFALPALASATAIGLCAALEAHAGVPPEVLAGSPLPLVAGLAAIAVTGLCAGPLALAACAAQVGPRTPGAARARGDAALARRVAPACAAIPTLLAAPLATLATGGLGPSRVGATLAVAALAAVGVPLAFCELAASFEHARLAGARDADAPRPDLVDAPEPAARALDAATALLVVVAGALTLAALLSPSHLTLRAHDATTLPGPLLALDAHPTVRGTTVRLTPAAEGVVVSVADGGGAGWIAGLAAPRAYRTAPRPALCPTCFELELHGPAGSARTLLDAAGVRHDDGPAARLARNPGPWGAAALGLAIGGTLLGARRAPRRRATQRASAAAWLVAALTLARGLID